MPGCSADRAQSRAGIAAAAALLTRAAELTPSSRQRVQRALDAASANVEAGAFDKARQLLAMAELATDEVQRARIELIGAKLAFASNRSCRIAGGSHRHHRAPCPRPSRHTDTSRARRCPWFSLRHTGCEAATGQFPRSGGRVRIMTDQGGSADRGRPETAIWLADTDGSG
jgi:hypothetical protein